MAGPRYLDPERLSLEDLYYEALFSALRLRNAPEAKALVAAGDKLLDDVRKAMESERKLHEALIDAEVGMSLRNNELDAGVTTFKAVLLKKTGGSTEGALYQRFFAGRQPHEIIRLSLRPQLPICEPWVASLAADPDKELQEQGTALGKLVQAGKDAVAKADAATQALRDFRAGARAALFETANAERRSLMGELAKLKKPKEWVNSFFLAGRQRRDEGLPSVQTAQAAVVAAQVALVAAQKELQAAQQREADAAKQQADRDALQKELLTAKKQQEELKRRIAALEDELDE